MSLRKAINKYNHAIKKTTISDCEKNGKHLFEESWN